MIAKRRDITESEVATTVVATEAGTKSQAGESRMIDDAELFARFRQGDQEAFLELFDRHADRIGRFCYRMIGSQERARDVAQDVWVKLLKIAEEREQELRNPAGMLFTIARNLSLNAIRDRRDHTPLHVLADDHHPKTEMRQLSHLEELAIKALDQLPADQKEILVLHTYSDYTFEEIGEMLGEGAGTVRMRAYRARKKLKRVLSALIEFEENRVRGDQG